MIKLFVSDMDGTLLNANHIISDRTAQSVKRLQAQGIEFMIATGRTYHSAKPFLDMHEIDCEMINLNGAAIYSKQGDLLSSIPMDYQACLDMITYCQTHQIGYSVMDSKLLFVQNRQTFIDHLFKHLEQNKEEHTSQVQFVSDLAYIRNIEDFVLKPHQPILKMMILSQNPEELKQFRQVFGKVESIDITSSAPDNLEVTHKKAQKGLAIADYIKQKNWTMDQVATIGDSLNDRSMLQMAKYGYVMENANQEVKDISPLRAGHHNQNGVAMVIDQILDMI